MSGEIGVNLTQLIHDALNTIRAKGKSFFFFSFFSTWFFFPTHYGHWSSHGD